MSIYILIAVIQINFKDQNVSWVTKRIKIIVNLFPGRSKKALATKLREIYTICEKLN